MMALWANVKTLAKIKSCQILKSNIRPCLKIDWSGCNSATLEGCRTLNELIHAPCNQLICQNEETTILPAVPEDDLSSIEYGYFIGMFIVVLVVVLGALEALIWMGKIFYIKIRAAQTTASSGPDMKIHQEIELGIAIIPPHVDFNSYDGQD
jgi:hypothetical protein